MRTNVAALLFAALLALPLSRALAMPCYDDVLVVINAQSADSVEIGRYYQQQRRIPERNVCTISILPRVNEARMTVAERDTAVAAIQAHMAAHRLNGQINHVVLTPQIAYFSDNNMLASATYHLFDLYLMFMLSDPGVDIYSLNPFYHYINGNWDNLKEHSFSRRKYGFPMVTRLDGPGTANVRKLIDATGAPAYSTYTNGINFLVSYSGDADIYRTSANARGAEFISRGNIRLNEDFFTTPKGTADEPIMDESKIMFAYLNLVAESGYNDPPFTFWNLNYLPGSMLTVYRSFPTRKQVRTAGGVSRITVASKAQTEFRRADGADYGYRHTETLAVDPVRGRVWSGSGEKQENVWHQFGLFTHQRRGNGLALLDANTGALIAHYTQRNSALLNNRIVKLAYDRQADRVWVASYGGIQYIDLADNSFHAIAGLTADYAAAYDVYVSPYDTSKVYASFLYEGTSSRNSTITGAQTKLFEIDKPTGGVTEFTLANGYRPLIAQTEADTLWSVRGKSLVRYRRSTQQALNTVDLTGVLAPMAIDYPRALLAHTNSFGERQIFVAVPGALNAAVTRTNLLVRIVETGPATLATNVIALAAWNDTAAGSGNGLYYIRHLAADPQNPNHIYMALSKQHDATSPLYGQILRSTDGRGAVWESYLASSTTLENLNEIAFDGQGNLFCARGYHNNGQANASDFVHFGACAVGGGLDHENMVYNRAMVDAGQTSPFWTDPNEATRVKAGAANSAYTAGYNSTPLGPVMFKVLDGYGSAASRFGAYMQYPAAGGGGHTPHMLVMEPKVAPFAPRVNLTNTLFRTGLTNTLSARLFSPGLPASMDGFETTTINADTVALFDETGAYLAPSVVSYASATREIRYARAAPLPAGVYYLLLKGGAGGIKNSKGGALMNVRSDEFRDETVLRYTVGGAPGNAAPVVEAGADQAVTWPQNTLALSGSASDDGLPAGLTLVWSKVSGPGAVAFGAPAAAATEATFGVPGVYILRLSASDGELAVADDVIVTVRAATGGDGLVAHWDFEDSGGSTVSDASGNGHAATLSGGVTRGAGRLGKGLVCDGTNGTADAGAEAAFNLTERMTISAWVYAESAPGAIRGRTVASRLGGGRQDAAAPGWNLGAAGVSDSLSFTVRDRQGNSATAACDDFFVSNLRKWVHLVGVFEGGESLALYVNGTLSQRVIGGIPARLSYEPGALLALGRKSTGGDAFHGRLDEVRLYDYALGATEIAALYEAGTAGNAAPAVEAGVNATIRMPTNTVRLIGAVADDGQPPHPGAPTVRWTQTGGPSGVTLSSPELVETLATLTQAGTYQFAISATDGELSATDSVTVTVLPPAAGGYVNFALNQPADAFGYTISGPINGHMSKAVDGDRTGVNSKWWATYTGQPWWFKVGLGGFRTIDEVRLDCQDLSGTVGTLYDFEIRLHRGAAGYTTVYAVTNNSAPTVICHFTPTVCSNVYLSITRKASEIMLYELEAYYTGVAPTPPATLPTVALTAPANGSVVPWGQNVTLSATITDPSNVAARVEFYAGALKVGQDTTAPYSLIWSSPAAGLYTLQARVVDIYNREALSATRTLAVNQAPTASVTTPAPGTLFLLGETIPIAAAAADGDGSVTNVVFLADGGALGSQTTPPYSRNWNNAASGAHALTVVATDNRAASVSSAPVNIVVTNAAVAPTILAGPTNTTVGVDRSATFRVQAQGTALSYQWRRNDGAIGGAGGASYSTPATTTDDSGARFSVTVSNTAGVVTSADAILTVLTLPEITQQPTNRTVGLGQTASFSAQATGAAPLSYQWRKNGAEIAGASSATYTTPPTASGDDGAVFRVLVSNPAGVATSEGAALDVETTLVAHWKLDETDGSTAADSSGYGNPLRLVNGPTWTAGRVDGALQLDRAALQYGVASNLAVNVAAGGFNTVAFWMKWNGVSAAMPFGWNAAYDLYFASGSFGFNTGQGNILGVPSDGFAGQWVHVVAVFPNGTVLGNARLYINGVAQTLTDRLANATTATDKIATPVVVLSGWGAGSPDSYRFGGALDDVRIYNRELNILEVSLLAGAELPAPPEIVTQPTNQTVNVGQPATFRVTATGAEPLTIQWRRNGAPIGGANAATYTTPATVLGDDGARFSVTLSNIMAVVASDDAVLTVRDTSLHALPYRESFERFAPDFLLPGFEGWSAEEPTAARVSTNRARLYGLHAYAEPIGFPLRAEDHDQGAVFDGATTNRLAAPANTAVWSDMMVELSRTSEGRPIVPAEVHSALCLDSDGRLNLWHRDLAGGSNRWSALPWQTAATTQWARVTLYLDYATVDTLHNARYSRFYMDGVLQSGALGYSTNNGMGTLGGPWFAMAVANTPTKLTALLFSGNGTLDDLVVDTARPLIGLGPHGTPEWWLADHDLTNGNSLAENELEDADNDRFPNWKEREAFTDPNDPESLLRVTALAEPLANGRLPLTLQTIPGQRYTLQGTTNLVANLWEEVPFSLTSEGLPEVQNVLASGSSLLLYVAPDAPLRFYRVNLVP